MKVGLVGVGRIGAFHARTLADDLRVSEMRITDADPARAELVASSVGATVSPDPGSLGTWADALVIAAATDAHDSLIELGASAGLPTFCEKPISLNLETTNRVLDKVAAAGIQFQIGFQRRFDRGYAELRRIVRSGALGTIYAARLATHDPEPPAAAYLRSAGGIFADQMIHDFDILRWTTGLEVVRVHATGSSLTGAPVFEGTDEIDTSVVVATLEGGAIAMISSLRHDPRGHDVRMELFGSKDSVVTGMDDRAPLRSVDPGGANRASEYADFLDRFGDAYRAELREFVSVALGETESTVTGVDARRAQLAAEVASLSYAEGRPVDVSEVG